MTGNLLKFQASDFLCIISAKMLLAVVTKLWIENIIPNGQMLPFTKSEA